MKEYSTKELNKLARKDIITQIKAERKAKKLPTSHNNDDSKNEEEDDKEEMSTRNYYMEHLKDLEEEPLGTPNPNNPDDFVKVITKTSTTT